MNHITNQALMLDSWEVISYMTISSWQIAKHVLSMLIVWAISTNELSFWSLEQWFVWQEYRTIFTKTWESEMGKQLKGLFQNHFFFTDLICCVCNMNVIVYPLVILHLKFLMGPSWYLKLGWFANQYGIVYVVWSQVSPYAYVVRMGV